MPTPPELPPAAGRLEVPDQLRIRVGGRIQSIALEDYVVGTALSEVSPVGDSAEVVTGIFRVQTIIARTYAVFHQRRHASEGFDLCDTTHCQVYQPARLTSSRFAAAARQAAVDTSGQILAYGARPAEALFHADCGGHTAAAEVIWGGRVPYLLGTPDQVPDGTHRHWQFAIGREALRLALNAGAATAAGTTLHAVRIVQRDSSGRAETVEVTGDAVRQMRGEQVRAAVNQQHGPLAVRSTRFDLTLQGDTYNFDGTGWGHGVGLCQVGAAARVRRGESVSVILATYYPGARLVRGF
jgi:stage II sporulation protein D